MVPTANVVENSITKEKMATVLPVIATQLVLEIFNVTLKENVNVNMVLLGTNVTAAKSTITTSALLAAKNADV